VSAVLCCRYTEHHTNVQDVQGMQGLLIKDNDAESLQLSPREHNKYQFPGYCITVQYDTLKSCCTSVFFQREQHTKMQRPKTGSEIHLKYIASLWITAASRYCNHKSVRRIDL